MDLELDPHTALIYTMVLVSAAEGRMSDREVGMMTRMVQHLPIFTDFHADQISAVGEDCATLLKKEEGISIALARIARARLRETAYVLACDVAAADQKVEEAELRLLELLRDRLNIDPLVAAAIERAARARYRVL
jgi:tellurite resistance protein